MSIGPFPCGVFHGQFIKRPEDVRDIRNKMMIVIYKFQNIPQFFGNIRPNA